MNYLARHGGLECPCRQEDYMSNDLQLHIINAAESRRLRQSNSLKGPASHKSDNVHPKVPANFAKRIMNYPKGPALPANQIICMRGSLQLSRLRYVHESRHTRQNRESRAGNNKTHVAAQHVATDPRKNCVALIECDRSAIALREKCTYGQVGATS